MGALRLDGTPTGCYYRSRELDDNKIRRFVALAEQTGLLLACKTLTCAHPVVLDLFDAEGDIVDDRCVPSEQAWAALNSELALATASPGSDTDKMDQPDE
ncbi:MAG: hypothetical protein DLM61_19450 [Pseudonocardiales bacterium]|nr:MAG: hypothetical protein DLM61_19450 [Pseudonocardiales bacterium]